MHRHNIALALAEARVADLRRTATDSTATVLPRRHHRHLRGPALLGLAAPAAAALAVPSVAGAQSPRQDLPSPDGATPRRPTRVAGGALNIVRPVPQVELVQNHAGGPMHRPITPIAMRCVGVVLGVAAVCAMIAPGPARADIVTDWNGYASTAIVATAGQPPPVSVLSFAMAQGAVYDAVDAIDRGHRPYLIEPAASPLDSKEAAAATAAFRVLVALFPTQQPTLQALYDTSLAAVEDAPPGAKAGGIAIGEAAAAAMLSARANDGRFGPFTPVIGTAPGVWRPTPPLFAHDPAPWVGNVRPFLVPNAQMLRSDGPHPLSSRAYAKDFNEIKEIGSLNSTTRTPDETDAAIFWQEPVFALWNRIFRTLVAQQHLDTVDSARLFALENLAAADAAIGCWNDKYHWNSWRPITAIREAASDGNPATDPNPTWTPLFDPSTPVATPPALATPPFPEHPSGHNCAAGAIVRTLRYFFDTDKIAFSATSSKSGTTRTFHRLSDALTETINARVWAGIHFRTADVQGAKLGQKVARYLHNHYLQPVD